MRKLVADASHELGAPLTSIMGLSELYLQQGGAASRAQVARIMSAIHAEADRMRLLVDDLLLLAELDQARPLDSPPVDLATIAAAAAPAANAARPGPVFPPTAPALLT